MAKRSDNGEGSCKRVLSGRHEGKWRVQYTFVDEYGRKERISRLFSTRSDGMDLLRSLRRGERAKAELCKRELTLAEWFDWLCESEWPESIAESTLAARKGRFDKYVRKEWGVVPLVRIDPVEIKAFYAKLAAKGVGKPTVLELKRDLVRVYNLAVRPYRRVPWQMGNPFALRVPTPEKRAAVALTPAEAGTAISSAELSDVERALLALFLLSGLRLSEAMALTWGQLNFGRGLILVDRAVKFDPKRRQRLGLPKGTSAVWR